MGVAFDTVLSLTSDYLKNTLEDDEYFLCTNPKCNIAYYSLKGRTIKVTDIKSDIWFKKSKKKFIVCYCRDISLDDIVLAVDRLELPNLQKIVHYLQKDDIITDCIHHNPTSVCCQKLFDNAIEYAKKIKNRK
jgi:hypothetical protein